jgi:hypothetical protein
MLGRTSSGSSSTTIGLACPLGRSSLGFSFLTALIALTLYILTKSTYIN